MNRKNRELSLKIINDFRQRGYSYFKLPKELSRGAHSLATSFYELDVIHRISGLANSKSGVLGYYPSELEAKEIVGISGTTILTMIGARSRGYSSFDFLEEESVFLGNPLLLENVWIDSAPIFKRRALSLYKKFKTIARSLSCDLSNLLASTIKVSDPNISQYFYRDCLSLMRILNYRADEITRVSKEHTDYEFVTLTVSTCDGLEIKANTGNWEVVPNLVDHAILIPGDMFEVATNGYIKSTLHRARCGEKARNAVVFFQGLPLDFEINYSRLGDNGPRSFGEHIFSMLLRSSAHLASEAELIANQLNIEMPLNNPFRLGK